MISLILLFLELIYLYVYYIVKSKSVEKSLMYIDNYTVNGRKLLTNTGLEIIRSRVNSKRSKF